jgi:hypothetical protein
MGCAQSEKQVYARQAESASSADEIANTQRLSPGLPTRPISLYQPAILVDGGWYSTQTAVAGVFIICVLALQDRTLGVPVRAPQLRSGFRPGRKQRGRASPRQGPKSARHFTPPARRCPRVNDLARRSPSCGPRRTHIANVPIGRGFGDEARTFPGRRPLRHANRRKNCRQTITISSPCPIERRHHRVREKGSGRCALES